MSDVQHDDTEEADAFHAKDDEHDPGMVSVRSRRENEDKKQCVRSEYEIGYREHSK